MIFSVLRSLLLRSHIDVVVYHENCENQGKLLLSYPRLVITGSCKYIHCLPSLLLSRCCATFLNVKKKSSLALLKKIHKLNFLSSPKNLSSPIQFLCKLKNFKNTLEKISWLFVTCTLCLTVHYKSVCNVKFRHTPSCGWTKRIENKEDIHQEYGKRRLKMLRNECARLKMGKVLFQ